MANLLGCRRCYYGRWRLLIRTAGRVDGDHCVERLIGRKFSHWPCARHWARVWLGWGWKFLHRPAPLEHMCQLLQGAWRLLLLFFLLLLTVYDDWHRLHVVIMARVVGTHVMLQRRCVKFSSPTSFVHWATERLGDGR